MFTEHMAEGEGLSGNLRFDVQELNVDVDVVGFCGPRLSPRLFSPERARVMPLRTALQLCVSVEDHHSLSLPVNLSSHCKHWAEFTTTTSRSSTCKSFALFNGLFVSVSVPELTGKRLGRLYGTSAAAAAADDDDDDVVIYVCVLVFREGEVELSSAAQEVSSLEVVMVVVLQARVPC